jgi:hypothetical protein
VGPCSIDSLSETLRQYGTADLTGRTPEEEACLQLAWAARFGEVERGSIHFCRIGREMSCGNLFPLCTENLSPGVVVAKSAKDGV